MRISVVILIFLILFNGWAGLLQQYDVDDHLGIGAETGDPEALNNATKEAESIQTGGDAVGGTLLGFYNALSKTVEGMFRGIEPGVAMLLNIVPPGVAEDFITWLFTIIHIIMAIDMLAYLRGVDL